MKAALVQAHLWVARLILGALLLQVFFAGLGIFGAASFVPHARLGFMIVFAAAILLLLALAARADRSSGSCGSTGCAPSPARSFRPPASIS